MQTSAAMGKMNIQDFALNNLGTFVAIVIVFINNVVLEKDMKCICESGSYRCLGCFFYFTGPLVILVVFQLWTEKMLLHTCASREECRTFSCCHMCTTVLKALFIGLLWVVSVLIDGDWAACCFDNEKVNCFKSPVQNLTSAELKNISLVAGLILLLVLVLTAFLAPLCERKWCEGKSRDVVYGRWLLEERDKVLEEILRESAKEKWTAELKEKIDGGGWKKCLDVVGELTNSASKPSVHKEGGATGPNEQADGTGAPATPRARSREEGTNTDGIPLLYHIPRPSEVQQPVETVDAEH